jgi:hypothetical protein
MSLDKTNSSDRFECAKEPRERRQPGTQIVAKSWSPRACAHRAPMREKWCSDRETDLWLDRREATVS